MYYASASHFCSEDFCFEDFCSKADTSLEPMTPSTHIIPSKGSFDPQSRRPYYQGLLSSTPHLSSSDTPKNCEDHPKQIRTAFATPSPLQPLVFTWRCCQPCCNNSPPLDPTGRQKKANTRNNTTHTTTHFKWVQTCVGSEDHEANTWQPGYRDEECRRCSHKACSNCILLSVNGETEWRGAMGELAAETDLWARLGVWDGAGSGTHR